MKYYRIKPEYDNARLLNRAKRTFDGILIGNEWTMIGQLCRHYGMN